MDIPEWEKFQDEIAGYTNMGIVTVDYKGNPVSKHSHCSDFCSVIRSNEITCSRCIRSDSLAGLEAIRLNRPYIYLCHCGLVSVAVPVLAEDRYLGAVMFGQIKMKNGSSSSNIAAFTREFSSFKENEQFDEAELLAMYKRLPEMEYSEIQNIANLIQSMVSYIVNRAVKIIEKNNEYENKLLYGTARTNPDASSEEDISQGISRLSVPPAKSEYSRGDYGIKKSSPVYPAVQYIQEHPKEMIAMKEMAELCHLSQGYFSRLFKSVVGENFVDYVNRKKIEMAISLLNGTESSITDIAFELGFQDASYFVKVFKRFQGVTPSEYRKAK